MVWRIVSICLILVIFTSARGENGIAEAAEVKAVYFEPGSAIAFPQVWAAMLAGNPDLQVYQWEARAQEGAALQAGLSPNPELGFMIEQFGGSASRSGFNAAETTVQLSQPLQTAGKRTKAQKAAVLGKDSAQWEYGVKRLEVLAEVSGIFAEVLALQEKQQLLAMSAESAEKTVGTMAARVSAGKAALLEQTKAEVALSFVKIEQEKAARRLASARSRLAAMWGGQETDFLCVQGEFYRRSSIPGIDNLREQLKGNPAWVRWETELSQRRAKVELEKAKRYPDITVIAGLQNYQDEPGTAMVAGFAVPLPLFDRNQGGIAESQARFRQGHYAAQAARVRLASELEQIYQELTAIDKQVEVLEKTVIPGAELAYQSAQEGYAYGKFGSLDVLDAQRTLFEARGQYIDAMLAYHQACAELVRLTGNPAMKGGDAAGETGEKQ